MRRVLEYARETGFTKYTSTLLEAWHLSVSGLSTSIIEAAGSGLDPSKILVDEALAGHPIARFGLMKAKRHQERGVSLTMFFGLLKYYRQAYVDLLELNREQLADYQGSLLFFTRLFDIIEAGIVIGWAGGDTDQVVYRMQLQNREMTNEKNTYLTIFESIPNPVLFFCLPRPVKSTTWFLPPHSFLIFRVSPGGIITALTQQTTEGITLTEK